MLRIIGLILVVLGSLCLGYQGFIEAAHEQGNGEIGDTIREQDCLFSASPVISGIAVVSGLLLLASGGRRGDD